MADISDVSVEQIKSIYESLETISCKSIINILSTANANTLPAKILTRILY